MTKRAICLLTLAVTCLAKVAEISSIFAIDDQSCKPRDMPVHWRQSKTFVDAGMKSLAHLQKLRAEQDSGDYTLQQTYNLMRNAKLIWGTKLSTP